ncbi:ABC transporter permease [Gorillibacterium massiliense]|uniref:ABC transporter permease n=1 Tax=Gorillibacterium massiliense TaxID=1280390 RepID=UPI0004B55937|nr:ABC transporter permease subunit [Gorillibacterium massiliense]
MTELNTPKLFLFQLLLFVRHSAKELVRKKVFIVTLVLTVLFLALFYYGVGLIGSNERDASDSALVTFEQGVIFLYLGIFFAQFIIAFLVLFSSMGAIATEVENGQMLAVLARPIERWKVYLGKWAGFALWSAIFAGLVYTAILFIVNWQIGMFPGFTPALRGLLMFMAVPVLLSAVTLLGSSYLPTLGNGVASALLFGLGMFGGMLEKIVNMNHTYPGIEKFGLLTSLVMPTDALIRRVDYELMGGGDIPSFLQNMGPFSLSDAPSNTFLVYTGVYVAALLLWGCIHFTNRDI